MSSNVLVEVFFIGFISMISLHNFVKSILLYRAGRDKYLTLLKVTFNIGITAYFIIEFSFFVTVNLSLDDCKKISYLQTAFNYLMMQSLAAFMLVLIRQYEKNVFDAWMSIGLLVIRTGFHILYIFSIDPQIVRFDDNHPDLSICDSGMKVETGYSSYSTILVAVDTFIDTYVMVRLLQIQRRCSFLKRYMLQSSNILFNLIMFWNFFNVSIAFWSQVLMGLKIFDNYQMYIKYFILIILSYLVTADSEYKWNY